MKLRHVLLACSLVPFLLAAPSSACSLIHEPFDQPTYDPVLRYVSGSELVRLEGPQERVVAEGFFLSYAPAGAGVVVAGQDGLSASCSGDRWLAFFEDGEQQWRQEGPAQVWAHPEGPIVRFDDAYHRFEEGALVPWDVTVPDDVRLLGWSHQLEPVYRDDAQNEIGIGSVRIPLEGGGYPAMAVGPDATAVVVVDGPEARLHVVREDAERGPHVESLQWTVGDAFQRPSVAWADGWIVAASKEAYLFQDDAVALGVEAVRVGARGQEALVFTEDGYQVFQGARPIESWQRGDGKWTPVMPESDPRPIDVERSDGTSNGPGGTATTAPPNGTDTATSGQDAPGAAVPLLLASLALLVLRRRR